MSFKPLEYTVPQRQVDDGYMKLIVDKENEVGAVQCGTCTITC